MITAEQVVDKLTENKEQTEQTGKENQLNEQQQQKQEPAAKEKEGSQQQQQKQEPDDFFEQIEKRAGRKVDEDYLKTDYREKATTTEKELSELKKTFDDAETKQFLELRSKGIPTKDILESMSIDVDKMEPDELILDKIKRDHPYFTKDQLNEYAMLEYGVGADLKELEASKETEDKRLFLKILANRNTAEKEQKTYLQERKITLSTPPQKQEEQAGQKQNNQEQEYGTKVAAYQKQLADSLKEFKELEFAGVKHAIDPQKLKEVSDAIVLEEIHDNVPGVLMQGVSAKEALQALYLFRHGKTLVSEIAADKEKTADEAFNNVQSPKSEKSNKNTPNVTVTRF